MKKVEWALSNEVYIEGNNVHKHIISSPFKDIMSHNEADVIRAYYSDVKLIDDKDNKIITTRIDGEHHVFYTDKQIVDIALEIKRFHKVNIDNKSITPFEEAYRFLGGTRDISKEIEILHRDPVLLHNDLVEGNIIIDNDEKVTLIDFEYSGYGNEIYDVASFLTERELKPGQESIFVKQFDIDLEELELIKKFLNEFWALWARMLYKETGKEIYKTIYEWKEK